MKHSFLLLLFLPLLSSAQEEFAPIGANWYVNAAIDELGAGGYLEDYYLLESKGDTTIGARTYRQVGDHLFYQDGEQVYYLLNDSLRLIYDFEVEVGDTVDFDMLRCFGEFEDEWYPITFRVAEVTQEEVQGVSLKKVRCEYIDEEYYYGGQDYIYMERLGSQRVLIEDFIECDLIGTAFEEWLRCYEDEDLLYKTPAFLFYEEENCDYRYITNTKEATKLTKLSVFPNPTTNHWILEWNYPEKAHLQITDLQGRLLHEQEVEPGRQEISAEGLPPGVYLLQIRSEVASGSVKVVKW